MSLMVFEKCWRGRMDCESFHAIDAPPEGVTEEQWANRDYIPSSFVCCGCVAEPERAIPQDAYRVCWKNRSVDEIGEYDEQDLTHMLAVVSHSLAIIATRRVNSGMIAVPTKQGAEV